MEGSPIAALRLIENSAWSAWKAAPPDSPFKSMRYSPYGAVGGVNCAVAHLYGISTGRAHGIRYGRFGLSGAACGKSKSGHNHCCKNK